MSGADLNLATPASGSPDLTFGAAGQAPGCGPTDLCLARPRVAGQADLAFGAASAPAQGAVITADIPLPEVVVDADIIGIASVTSDTPLPDVVIDGASSYLVNVWRGPQRMATAPHQPGARTAAEASGPWRAPARLKPRMGDTWQPAAPRRDEIAAGWGALIRHHDAMGLVFASAAHAMRDEASSAWGYPARQGRERALPWQIALPGVGETASPIRYPPRQQASESMPWGVAMPRAASVRKPWQGRPASRRMDHTLPWQDAYGVISLWPRPDKWTPPIPPRVVTPDLDLICPRTPGDTLLAFMLSSPRQGRDEPVIIPIQRAYIVIHDIDLYRLSDNIPIPASRLSIEIDMDAWAWGFSATLLGKDALDAVMPSSLGEPVILVASVNGNTWHLMMEDWSENREFGKRGVSVKGRGISAELASPYQLPGSGVTTSDMTVQQLLAAHLPTGEGWAITWAAGTPDWLVPAGAWTWSGKAPIQAIHEAATGAGLVVVPAKASRSLNIMPRYPVLPWNYSTATPNLVIPESAILSLARQQSVPTQANAVYVHGGETGGQLARVKRAGTAGDRVAAVQSSPLMTHPDGLRLLGSRILAAHHRQPDVRSITTTMGGAYPLGEIGQLLKIEMGAASSYGIINAVSLDVSMSDRAVTVRQTLTIGENTPNTWTRFKRLLPADPLLIGTIESVHTDGTATVNLLGGGTMRVRGTGNVGQAVYVRGGMIEGQAPSMAQVEIDA